MNGWLSATPLRVAAVLAAAGGVIALLWWRGPDWGTVWHAFDSVRWQWVVVAIGLNLLSVVVRATAWRTVVKQAMEPPHPSHLLVFSAFSVGLFTFAFASARRHHTSALDTMGPIRRLVTMGRHGLGVLHAPGPAAVAAFFQCCGWLCQFFAVYTAMRAFHIHSPSRRPGSSCC